MKNPKRGRKGINPIQRMAATLPLIPVLFIGLTGCQSPPDVEPFAESSEALLIVAQSTGSQISGELRRRGGVSDDSEKWEELRERFDNAWSIRVEALGAVADYSAGLVAVVESGNQGEANAQKVLNGAETLLQSFGSAFPAGSPAVEILSEAIVKGYGVFAKDQAAKSVAEAVAYVSPAIEELAAVLADDLETMGVLAEDLRRDEIIAINARNAMGDERNTRALNSLIERRVAARDQAISSGDADDLEKLGRLNTLYEQELASPWHTQMQADLDEANRTWNRQLDVIQSAGATVRAWGQAHAKLERAASTQESPSFALLVQMTRELLDDYTKEREE